MATTKTAVNQTQKFSGEALKSKLKTASALTLPVLSFLASMTLPGVAGAVDPTTTPTGENVLAGGITTERPYDGRLNVHQSTNRALIEWDNFDIGSNAWTQFYQPNSSAIAVNRVVGAGNDPTQILGTLVANGKLMVLDRNGVFFGPNSRVDVAGIVASTGDIDNVLAMDESLSLEDLRHEIKNIQPGEIGLHGTISIADGGYAAFVAPQVSNSGVITARLGKVELAGEVADTIDMYGDGLVEFEVTPEAKKVVVSNSGVIDAQGGVIAMTTKGVGAVADSVINMSGVAAAKSVSIKGGAIVLGGTVTGTGDNAKIDVIAKNTTEFTGTIEAGNNAEIEVSGHDLKLGGNFVVGEGAEITFDPVTFTIGAAEAATIVSAMGAGSNGTVNVEAQERIILNSAINTTAGADNGNTLNFRDEGGAAGLRVDLNSTITLRGTQKLTGDANDVYVANTGFIQNGLDVAASGAIVHVAAGTYNQTSNLVIGKAVNLRGFQADIDARLESGLRTAGDSDEAIIDFGNLNRKIEIQADNVTINGFEIRNSKRNTNNNDLIYANTASGAGDANSNGTWDGIVIKNNIIHDGGDEGVQLRDTTGAVIERNNVFDVDGDGLNMADGSVNGFIQDNEIYDTHSTNGQIYVYNSDNITIQRNYLHDITGNDAIKLGSDGFTDTNRFVGNVLNNRITGTYQDGVAVYSSGALISGNDISGSQSTNGAIHVQSDNANLPTNVVIENNNIHDNNTRGIRVSKANNLTIRNNSFDNNSGGHVEIRAGQNAAQVNVSGNSFGTSTGFAVSNGGSGTLKADNNWWNTTSAGGVMGRTAGLVDYSTYLGLGTDTDGGTSGFQGDYSNLYVTSLGAQTGAGTRINDAIATLADGSLTGGARLVNVTNGTYAENVIANKSLTLQGSGSGLVTIDGTGLNNNGILVAADDVTLAGVTVQDFRNNYVGQNYLASGVAVNSSIENLTMNDIVSSNNSAGFYATEFATIDGLDIDNSAFNGNDYGFYTAKDMSVLNATDNVSDVTVDNTSFNGNRFKGIYLEKLSDATFTNIDVIGSAYDASNVNANVAIEANLKNGAYDNITFDDVSISGGSPTPTLGGKAGVGISVKARNDGPTYSAKPATLTNVVIKNSSIDVSNGDIAVAISHGVTGATVQDNTLTGPQGVTVFNGASDITVEGNTINTQGAGGNGTIDGSVASVHGVGLFGAGGTNIVRDNTITGSGEGTGVLAVASNDVMIGGGTPAEGNTVSGYLNGVRITNAVGSTEIQNNTITGNTDTPAGRSASGFTTGMGIFLENATQATISDNTVSGNNDGIRILDSDAAAPGDIVVTGNTATGNTDRGILINRSDNVQVSENTASGNSTGVWFEASAGGVLSNNTISSNTANGVQLRNGTSNTLITGNVISNNPNSGVFVDGSLAAVTGTTIRGNNIQGTTLVRKTGAGTVNAAGNWWGTTNQNTINGKMVGSVDFSTYLGFGTDLSVPTKGFQADFSDLFVTTLGANPVSGSRINNAVALLADGSLTGGNRVIHVMSGNYGESVVINKAANVRGWQADISAADGRAGAEASVTGVTVSANDVTFNGFTVGASGVTVNGVSSAKVLNNKINATGDFGVYLNGGSNAQVSENAITGVGVNGAGVGLNGATGATVSGNYIDIQNVSGADGIWNVNGSNNTAIDGNLIVNAGRNAITLGNSTGIDVTGNTLRNAGSNGILISSGSTVDAFTGNNFRNNAQHINYQNGAGADIIVDSASGNQFFVDGAYKLTGDMTNDQLFDLEDLITHKMDNVAFGRVMFGAPGSLYVTALTGIQNAINASNNGDTIYVDKGTYNEAVVVNKDVTLLGYRAGESAIGRTGDESIVDPSSPGFHIVVDGVTLDGFAITDATGADGYGVWVDNADNVQVLNNLITNTSQAGLYGLNSDNLTFSGNALNNGLSGIVVSGGNGLTLGAFTGTGITGTDGVLVTGNTGNIALDGYINVAGENVALNTTGAITQNFAVGGIAAETLSGSASGADFAGTNNVRYVGNFTTGAGGFNLGNANNRIGVTGAVSSQGIINITNTKRVDVTSTGSVVSNGGNVNLTVSQNDFMYIDGTVDASAGDVSLASGSNIELRNGSVVEGNIVDLSSGNIVNQNAGGTIIAGTLTGSGEKSFTLVGTNNQITNLGNFTTGTSAFHNGGLTLNDSTGGLTITGNVSADGGAISISSTGGLLELAQNRSITSGDGNITLNGGTGGVNLRGSANAGMGDISVTGRHINFANNGVTTADQLTLTANTHNITQSAPHTINVSTLTGSSGRETTLSGPLNTITTLGAFTTGTVVGQAGGFTLNDSAAGLTIAGNVSTQGGNIDIDTAKGDLTVNNGVTISSNGGSISLTANDPDVVLNGAINAGNGAVNLSGDNVYLNAGSSVTGGAISAIATIGNIVQDGTSTITGDSLTGSAAGVVNLSSLLNDVNTLNGFTSGGFLLFSDLDDLTVNGIVRATNGNLSLRSGGLMTVNGTIDTDNGDTRLFAQNGGAMQFNNGSVIESSNLVDLNAESSITQDSGSTINTPTLKGYADGPASLTGTANTIGTLNGFTTTGNFTLNDSAGGLLIDAGVDSNGGVINISSTGGLLELAQNQTIVSDNGNIILNGGTGNVNLRGSTNAGAGNMNITGRGINFANNGVTTANVLTLTANTHNITQSNPHTINATTLTGSAGREVALDGPNNHIVNLGAFSAGNVVNTSGFTLNDADGGLTVTGNVSTQGGNIDIDTAKGDLTVNNGVTISSQGGSISLTANDPDVVVNGVINAGLGDVNLTGDNVYLNATGSVTGGNVSTVATIGQVLQNVLSYLSASKLTGSAATTASFMGSNHITTLGNFATGTPAVNNGGFELLNQQSLNVDGDITSEGGNVQLSAIGNIAFLAGGSIDAKGGNIAVKQSGTFSSVDADSINTTGTGTITMQQRNGGSIGNSIRAMNNTGAGLNTLTVFAGSYNESVLVDQTNLLLRGANYGVAGFGARGAESQVNPNSPGFHIIVDNVELNGFAVAGASGADGYGVWVDNADNVKILNNVINTSEQSGIRVQGSDNTDVFGNSLNANGIGVHVRNSTNVDIGSGTLASDLNRNVITNSVTDGVTVRNGQNVYVTNNTINTSGEDGVDMRDTTGNAEVRYNRVTGTTAGHGIQVRGIDNAQITNNALGGINQNGIHVQGGEGVDILNNTVTGTTSVAGAGNHGVYVLNGREAVISGNTIAGANATGGANGRAGAVQDGIHVENNEDVSISGNTIQGGNAQGSLFGTDRNGGIGAGNHGIYVAGSNDAIVSSNNILGGNGHIFGGNRGLGAGNDGVHIVDSNRANVDGNTTNYTSNDGVEVVTSNNANITANQITNAGGNGIAVAGGNNVGIAGNFIGDGLRAGAALDGISVNGGRSVTIDNNIIRGGLLLAAGAGDNGIEVVDNREAVITNNQILGGAIAARGAVNNGIYVSNSGAQGDANRDGVVITDNVVTGWAFSNGAGDDGIHVINSGAGTAGAAADISRNMVSYAGDDGIEVTDTFHAHIYDNTLTDIDDTGIVLSNTDEADVWLNTIDDAETGIALLNSGTDDAIIDENTITNVDTGIFADSVANLNIEDNILDGRTGAGDGDYGIQVINSANARIGGNGDGNTVQDFEQGIYVESSNGARIRWNDVSEFDTSGIVAVSSDDVNIRRNTVYNGLGDGIVLSGGTNGVIHRNTVSGVNGSGIFLSSTTNTQVTRNGITDADDNGIYGFNLNGGNISQNTVGNVVGTTTYGINLNASNFVTVGASLINGTNFTGNTVTGGTEAGIRVNGGGFNTIIANDLTDGTNADDLGDYGVDLVDNATSFVNANTITGRKVGVNVDGGDGNQVTQNILTGNGTAIRVADALNTNVADHATIDGNDIGIEVTGTADGTTIHNNLITNSTTYGILTSGSDVGAVTLTDNTLVDNTIGIRLESGLIDLSDLVQENIIENGDVGLQMEPVAGFEDKLVLVGNTLGATKFVNQNTYFIELKDGAYFVGGTPFIIDAQNVSFTKGAYVDFVPANSPYGPGILTLAQLQFLESMIFDLDDLTGRGQIFVGTVPGLDESDLFPNGLGTFGTPGAGFQLTILGLPTVPGAPGGNTNIGAFLNNLTPFAGGDQSPEALANINPAAGGDGSDLNAIAPAGGESINCWAQMGGIGANAAVSYNFSNSSADAMDAAAGCGG